METLITYGSNHKRSLVIQLNYSAIKSICIYNWNASDIDSINEPYIVAIWKVKKLKVSHTEPITDVSFNTLNSFSLN